ncbi:hypothetical protein GGS23DRAFT_593726 [Durotheca rogersii]|uniref:uncharacterized protein n=1 Tax=Durotheca rogersii TaxID=419775 RepID=UPI00221F81DD|nr:uncharacterized protein GGS23DRAFT_593726 [Durotheca rogersii]KAI5866997.1 hypothetical protein GGS23DRAFT_593726 [Durotheca rogersii]
MGSFIRSASRLIIRRVPREGRIDEEQFLGHGAETAAPDPATTAQSAQSTQGTPAVEVPEAVTHAPPLHNWTYRVPEDDPLTLYRLMVGISTSPYLGYSVKSPVGTRPAANIGIYTRVVSSEQKAKDSFKVYSVVINACYFFQIVVAASLTAMGAAGANNGVITAFGAINTIIAGFLTFLKGSGLPSRLKYYGDEWKKIREYIEQRERDFSRAGCSLDVHEVVATIDRMYNNTKREIEMNTPDSYTSVTGNVRTHLHRHHQHVHKDASLDDSDDGNITDRAPGADAARLESVAAKLRGIDERIAAGFAREIDEEIRRIEHAIARGVEDRAALLEREARELRAQAAAGCAREEAPHTDGVPAADGEEEAPRSRDPGEEMRRAQPQGQQRHQQQ